MHYINRQSWEETAARDMDKAFSALHQAEQKITQSPDSMKQFLTFSRNFLPQYSLQNTALLYDQNPQGKFFAEAEEYEKAGYQVSKGQPGNTIFVSFQENGRLYYRMGKVFELSQTDVPKSEYENFQYPERNCSPEELTAALTEYAGSMNIAVEYADLPEGNPGFYQQGKEPDFHQGKIILSTTLDPNDRASTMARNFAHALLTADKMRSDLAESYEFQSDALSILICSTCGLDVPDTDYQHMHSHYMAAAEKSGEGFYDLIDPVFISGRRHRDELLNSIDQEKEMQNARESERENESAAQKNFRMDQIQQMHEGAEVPKRKGRAIERDMEI
jgi:hypothetical protein